MTSSIDYLNYFYEILFRKTLDKVQNHWLLWFTAISQLKIPFADSRKYYHELLYLLNLSQHLKNDTILSIWNFFVATIQIIKKRCFFSFDAGWIECVQGCLQYVQFIFHSIHPLIINQNQIFSDVAIFDNPHFKLFNTFIADYVELIIIVY